MLQLRSLLRVGCIIAVSEQNPASLNTAVVFQKDMKRQMKEIVTLDRFTALKDALCENSDIKGALSVFILNKSSTYVR